MKIFTHKELAEHIVGKKILLLNSLGKDSVACLEWLTNYAHPSQVVSVFFDFIAGTSANQYYIEYLKKRYPSVIFKTAPNPVELSTILCGIFQSPIEMINFINSDVIFGHESFDSELYAEEIRKEFGCDFVCYGQSKYEEYSRRIKFNKRGILDGKKIFPIGMMSKKQVFDILKKSGVKLHPCYKVTQSTFDAPSYYKMRSGFLIDKKFKEKMYKRFPLLVLDKYRYEVLFNDRKRNNKS